jgi:hypothetical protein
MTSPRDRLLARFRDEAAGPPNGTEVALRCTDHGRFLLWINPPLPPARVACPPECEAPAEEGPALHTR